GRVVRPPHAFTKLVSLDAPKGINVVRDGSFVGVLAESEAAAIEAQKKLRARAEWQSGAEWPGDWPSVLKAHVAEAIVSQEVDDEAARGRGVKRLKASYSKPLIAHASIGPSCAVAQLKDGRLEVWSHTQGIFNLRRDLSLVMRMKEDDIVVRHAEGAACYRHNAPA